MSILIVWASPNTNGLTAAAKDSVMKGIANAGGNAEEVQLNGLRIDRCRTCGDGWGICRSEGKCTIPDDFEQLYNKLREADGIVWVTPVYWSDLAECLKSFLDRLRRCEASHNHDLKSKKCLLVACAGGTGNGAVRCLDNLERTLNHMGMTAVDRLPVLQFNKEFMIPALSGAGSAFTKMLIT